MNLFPLVGVVFALIGWGVIWGMQKLSLASEIQAMALALLPEMLAKGFHLDGLADTADAFLSGRDAARKLEIMHDSRIGTMGVLAIFAVLGFKYTLIQPLARMGGACLPVGYALMLVAGRTGILVHIATSRYARPEGLGKLWFESRPWTGIFLGIMLLAVCGGLWFSFPRCVVLLLLNSVFPCIWSGICRAHIGGATGDTIGCCEELCELLALAALLKVSLW